MESELNYARFGRQIALPEIGARGQRALATVGVCFRARGSDPSHAEELAEHLFARAGGRVSGDPTALRVEVASVEEVPSEPVAIACAAWAAVEAARRVLGERHGEMPAALMERLGMDRHRT